MATHYRFVVIDDDASELEWVTRVLRGAGHEVTPINDSRSALGLVLELRPDCVITDLMMPEIDGLEILVKIRERPEVATTPVVIVSGKIYDFDETRARRLGADLLITDTTYTDEAYASRVGWGHSCVSQVVALAHAAEVARLHLFHHDPSEDDRAIDRKLEQAREKGRALGSKTEISAPAQGAVLHLGRRRTGEQTLRARGEPE